MLGSLKQKAAGLAARATDAVSDIDLNSVKGKITTTVSGVGNTVSQSVSVAAERVRDRVSDPADAYDAALADLLEAADTAVRTSVFNFGILKEQEARLREANPYRN